MPLDIVTKLETYDNGTKVLSGYQNYLIDQDGFVHISSTDEKLRQKSFRLYPYLANLFPNMSVLDIGANGGYFSYQASVLGASHVTALDASVENYRVLVDILYGVRFSVLCGSINELSINAHDVVLALSVIHWLVGPDDDMRSYKTMHDAIARLSELSDDYLVIEWIENNDYTIRQWSNVPEEYRKDKFMDALAEFFNIEQGIRITDTRTVYICKK